MWDYLYNANGQFWTWVFIGDGGLGDYAVQGYDWLTSWF